MVTADRQQKAVFNLGPAAGIPFGEGRAFRVRSVDIAVFRSRTGEVFATQALCPHREGPLADGIVGAGKVICPLHAYAFDLATGRPTSATCEALTVYPVSTSPDGDMLLSLEA